MIFDSLVNAARYSVLDPRVAAGLRYLTTFDPLTEDGRYEIEGEELVAVVQSYRTAPGAERRFESHRRSLDLHYVALGRERILHAPAGRLQVESDPGERTEGTTFYKDPKAASSVLLQTGDFAILFPGDAHKAGCMAGGRDAVKKVVLRMRLQT